MQDALSLCQGCDDVGKEHAGKMLKGLNDRELEFQETIASASMAARNLWEERAEALCRQAHIRTEQHGGPSKSQVVLL